MATKYTFIDENVVLDSSENTVWEQEPSNEDEHYSDAVDVTLTEDASRNYEAVNDSDNDTQYFSILDNTSGMNLNDITQTTLSTTELEMVQEHSLESDNNPNDPAATVDMGGQQVILFRIDGSEELYGLQVAQDEEGNLQKFQFKVRQNEEGNFEAIPETIQLSPIDCDISQLLPQESFQPSEFGVKEMEDAAAIDEEEEELIKPIFTDNMLSLKQENDFLHEENDQQYEYEDEIDIKPNILIRPFVNDFVTLHADIDQDHHQLQDQQSGVHRQLEDHQPLEHHQQLEDASKGKESSIPTDVAHLEEMYEPSTEDDDLVSDDNIEQIFVKETESDFKALFEESDYSQDSQDFEESESESENEVYQIVNGLHVTADVDNNIIDQMTILQDKLNPTIHTRILKVQKQPELNFQAASKELKIIKSDHGVRRKLIVLKDFVEKENMANIKANPRSILKSSQVLIKRIIPEKNLEEEKFEKRFAKSKEAIRAKLFQNFIAQTKIIHAPVRRERLPRKQKIQPVTRTDEEIIVQEVYVPSNGYTSKPKPTITTETIQLSDTDEDYDPRRSSNKAKRKMVRKRKSQVEIVITDSESEESVVDVSNSDSDSNIEKIIVSTKRRRGRPSKLNKNQADESDNQRKSTDTELPAKRGRGRPSKAIKREMDSDTEEKSKESDADAQKYNTRKRTLSNTNTSNENKCTKCSKTFPSTGSLRTHLQYHNLKESNKRNHAQYSYKCDRCNDAFINNILLTRHIQMAHKTASATVCSICKRKFADKTQLENHKRSHLKEQMFKSTVTVNVTPAKIVKKSSLVNVNPFKCTYCGRVLSSAILLSSHIKNHARYVCKICKSSFVSKFTLDSHISKSCIADKRTPQKRQAPTEQKKPNDFGSQEQAISTRLRRATTMAEPSGQQTRLKLPLRSSIVHKNKRNSVNVAVSRKSAYNTRSLNSGLQVNSNLRFPSKRLVQLRKSLGTKK